MKTIFLTLLLYLPTCFLSQNYIVNEQFSTTLPIGWSSTTPSGWLINNYGVGNARSGAYCLRLSSATNGNSKYLYIPINVQSGYSYTIKLWTKRICGLTINTNETTNQTTLLSSDSYSNSNCNSNFSTWYQWSDTYVASFTGTMYFQILANTVYGGPTSIYIDDVTILESPPISLPIELLYFKGKNKGDVNHLYWSTASEMNNDYFTIEKSYNGFDFYEIDRFDGSGYSTNQINYEFIDNKIKQSIVYYKLKQTDYDGKFKYSDVISVDNRENNIPYILKRVDVLGKEVNSDYNGLIFNVYSDGKIIKVNNINY
jgi:hypothetical protein